MSPNAPIEPVTLEHDVDVRDAFDVPASAPLALRSPTTPVTLSDLAALKGEAIEVVEARVQVIATLRSASIRATHPEDWVLFKAPDEHGGQIVGYLQDGGCDRVRDLWGIEVFDVNRPEKVIGDVPGVFHYLVTGSGRCKLTRQTIVAIEGGRSSTDDFCRGKTGTDLELTVRKAARANLDGNITRELAGMQSVPADELARAWTGTSKSLESCRRGRGFGSAAERLGARSEKAPDVDPPVCPHCGATAKYRQASGTRAAFYGCPNWDKHKDQKFIEDADAWVAKQQKATAKAAKPAKATHDPVAEG